MGRGFPLPSCNRHLNPREEWVSSDLGGKCCHVPLVLMGREGAGGRHLHGGWSPSPCETGGAAALISSRFWVRRARPGLGPWIQDHAWQECEKNTHGDMQEAAAAAGFNPCLTIALLAHLEGARLLRCALSSLDVQVFTVFLPSVGSTCAQLCLSTTGAPGRCLSCGRPAPPACCAAAGLSPPAASHPAGSMAEGCPGGHDLLGSVGLALALL